MIPIEEWEIICEYIADKDADIRDLTQFIRKGDKIRLTRRK